MMHDAEGAAGRLVHSGASVTARAAPEATVNGPSRGASPGRAAPCYACLVDVFWPWFVIAQAAFPTLAPGSEVRLVSPDLLEVYAVGRVEAGRLTLEGRPLAPGTALRVLVFPPDADAGEMAAAASGAAAIAARVQADGVWIVPEDGSEAVALRALLAEQGIELALPGEAP